MLLLLLMNMLTLIQLPDVALEEPHPAVHVRKTCTAASDTLSTGSLTVLIAEEMGGTCHRSSEYGSKRLVGELCPHLEGQTLSAVFIATILQSSLFPAIILALQQACPKDTASAYKRMMQGFAVTHLYRGCLGPSSLKAFSSGFPNSPTQGLSMTPT